MSRTQVDIWVLPTQEYEAFNKSLTIRGRRQPFLLNDVQGLRFKWPGIQQCRFCTNTEGLRVCTGAHCPWQGSYAVCLRCRAALWAHGVCEGCAVVADADSLELLALERAQLILRGVPKQELQ
eukprot:COSAG01_NODE_41861_length_446_cov_1.178674_1_plen_122_part_10